MSDYAPELTFDAQKSLELDRAQAALEEAEASGDELRAEFAREWKRKLETEVFDARR